LGLATPAAIAVGLGQAARSGLLFRGGDAIETAARLRSVLFDKTGTLTLGRPLVQRIVVLSNTMATPPAGASATAAIGAAIGTAIAAGPAAEPYAGAKAGTSPGATSGVTSGAPIGDLAGDPAADLLRQAAALEQQSRHPLAHALLQEAQLRGLALPEVRWSRSISGAGVEGQLREDGPLIRVGRLDWLAAEGVRGAGERDVGESGYGSLSPKGPQAEPAGAAARVQAELEGQGASVLAGQGASVLAVAADDRLLGLIAVQDPPRPDAASTLAALRQRGLRLGLLSGDREEAVRGLAAQLGLQAEELAWQLRPEQKQERILAARAHGPVAMVGDGINDAPALAAADLGIAVGTGTQIAQESADLVVLGERLEGLVIALDLARGTMAKVRQNLAWAFGYNLIALPIAAGALLPGFGLRLSPPLAALLMAGSSITVVLNALLLQRSARPAATGR
jgi:Cu2+-exporting ATPase